MMNSRAHILLLPLLLLAACASLATTTRRHGDNSSEIRGTLVEARHYLETNAIGDAHTLCAFLSALGEAPLGIVEDNGTLILLATQPSRIAMHVSKSVRATGKLNKDAHLLAPESLQVKVGAAWTPARL